MLGHYGRPGARISGQGKGICGPLIGLGIRATTLSCLRKDLDGILTGAMSGPHSLVCCLHDIRHRFPTTTPGLGATSSLESHEAHGPTPR